MRKGAIYKDTYRERERERARERERLPKTIKDNRIGLRPGCYGNVRVKERERLSEDNHR